MENKHATIKAIKGNRAERSTYFPGQYKLQEIEKYFKDVNFAKMGRYGGMVLCKVPVFALFVDKAIRDDYFRAMADELNSKRIKNDSIKKLLAVLLDDTRREACYEKMVFEIGEAAKYLAPISYKKTLLVINNTQGTRRYLYLNPTGNENINPATDFFKDRVISEENIINLTGKYQEIVAKCNQASEFGSR